MTTVESDTGTDRCEFCGEDYTDPNGVAPDQYMWEGHVIMECEEVPDDVRDWYNEPCTEVADG